LCGNGAQDGAVIITPAMKLFAIEEHKLLFCALPKTGVSSWKTFLMKTASNTTGDIRNEHSTLNLRSHGVMPVPPGPLNPKFKSYYIFMTTRHPMTRLISAYKDKVFGKIRGHMEGCRNEGVHLTLRPYPTWVEFATYVANGSPDCANRHWLPFDQLCPICQLGYNAVTKLEHIESDVEYFKDKQNIPEGFEFDQRNAALGAPNKTTRDYIMELPEEVFRKLTKMFSNDMKLFGYKIAKDRQLICQYDSSLDKCC
jgi:hypothetical protein